MVTVERIEERRGTQTTFAVKCQIRNVSVHLQLPPSSTKFREGKASSAQWVMTPEAITIGESTIDLDSGDYEVILAAMKDDHKVEPEGGLDVLPILQQIRIRKLPPGTNIDFCLARALQIRNFKYCSYHLNDPSVLTQELLDDYVTVCPNLLSYASMPPSYNFIITEAARIHKPICVREVADWAWHNRRDYRIAGKISKKLIREQWVVEITSLSLIPARLLTEEAFLRCVMAAPRNKVFDWPENLLCDSLLIAALPYNSRAIPDAHLTDAVLDAMLEFPPDTDRHESVMRNYFGAPISAERIEKDLPRLVLPKRDKEICAKMSPDAVELVLRKWPKAPVAWTRDLINHIAQIEDLCQLIPEGLRPGPRKKSARS